MNRKGFTLVELIATLVVLGLIMTIVLVSVTDSFSSAKEKSEEAFVETIKDAMEIYLSSDARGLTFDNSCGVLDKTNGRSNVYRKEINFDKVINSTYKPITQKDLVNPANKDQECNQANKIKATIYRDDDYVYYYSIDKSSFGCLKSTGQISNLPEGFVCK